MPYRVVWTAGLRRVGGGGMSEHVAPLRTYEEPMGSGMPPWQFVAVWIGGPDRNPMPRFDLFPRLFASRFTAVRAWRREASRRARLAWEALRGEEFDY